MLLHLLWTTLLGLASSLPLELEYNHENAALAVRDAGAVMTLGARSSSGVTYNVNQNFLTYSSVPSFNGPFGPNSVSFYFQGDGNAVAYNGDPVTPNAVWDSGTGGHGDICSNSGQCYLVFQGDGNLVIYIGGSPAWATGTAGKGYTVAFNGQAPYVVIYNRGNSVIWSSPGPPPPPPRDPPCNPVCP